MRPVDAWFTTEELCTKQPVNRRKQIEADGEAMVWLTEDLSWIVQFENGDRIRFTAKTGYKFDGASIPMPLQWLIGTPFGGAYTAPACAHDILCESKILNAWDAGMVFNILMDKVDVARWRRKAMFWSVRRLCQPIQDKYSSEKITFAKDHLDMEAA